MLGGPSPFLRLQFGYSNFSLIIVGLEHCSSRCSQTNPYVTRLGPPFEASYGGCPPRLLAFCQIRSRISFMSCVLVCIIIVLWFASPQIRFSLKTIKPDLSVLGVPPPLYSLEFCRIALDVVPVKQCLFSDSLVTLMEVMVIERLFRRLSRRAPLNLSRAKNSIRIFAFLF